jgi:hypothetical protein
LKSAALRHLLIACATASAAASAGARATQAQSQPQSAESARDQLVVSEDTTWYLPDAPAAELEAFKSRWRAIGEESKSAANEFAGAYVQYGAMRTSYFRWAPGAGFVYAYVYENFSVIDFSYGKVAVTPSGIAVIAEREQTTREPLGRRRATPRRLVTAAWGGSNYLIPVGEMRDFGNYVAGLGQYNDFNGPCCEFAPFLVAARRASPAAPPGRPAVPAQYAWLMKEPIEAKIEQVGRGRVVKGYGVEGAFYGEWYPEASLTTVRIGAGARQRVRRGLLFRLLDTPDAGQFLKITKVGRASSAGVIIRGADDGREYCFDANYDKRACAPVPVGSRVTTRPF